MEGIVHRGAWYFCIEDAEEKKIRLQYVWEVYQLEIFLVVEGQIAYPSHGAIQGSATILSWSVGEFCRCILDLTSTAIQDWRSWPSGSSILGSCCYNFTIVKVVYNALTIQSVRGVSSISPRSVILAFFKNYIRNPWSMEWTQATGFNCLWDIVVEGQVLTVPIWSISFKLPICAFEFSGGRCWHLVLALYHG